MMMYFDDKFDYDSEKEMLDNLNDDGFYIFGYDKYSKHNRNYYYKIRKENPNL
jgi:hypothetical protein